MIRGNETNNEERNPEKATSNLRKKWKAGVQKEIGSRNQSDAEGKIGLPRWGRPWVDTGRARMR